MENRIMRTKNLIILNLGLSGALALGCSWKEDVEMSRGGVHSGSGLLCENGGTLVTLPSSVEVCDCPLGTWGEECQVTTTMVADGSSGACALRSDNKVTCWGTDDAGYALASPPAGAAFTSIAVATNSACGLRSNGALACWGGPGGVHEAPPTGTFTNVRGTSGGFCAQRTNGQLTCWGMASPSTATFESYDLGLDFGCGVRSDQTLECWGDGPSGETTPPSGTFQSVSTGRNHVCGVRTDGTLSCWGANMFGESSPPSGTYKSVAVPTQSFGCALRDDDTIACWGNGSGENSGALVVPSGPFERLFPSRGGMCAVTADQTVNCFEGHETNPISGAIRSESVASTGASCMIRPDESMVCWEGSVRSNAPGGKYRALVSGTSCAQRLDGSLVCTRVGWAEAYPSEPFAAVSLGPADIGCGIREDGTVTCWGGRRTDFATGLLTAPLTVPEALLETTFTSVAVGSGHACGLDSTGVTVCWGDDINATGVLVPPAQVFNKLDSGSDHTCGLTADGAIVCWGNNASGQLDTPPGTFTDFVAGGVNCGVKTDGSVVCWGGLPITGGGETPYPGGAFTKVDTGGALHCGLRPDSTVACWGSHFDVAATTAPAGTFTDVSVDHSTACALDTKGNAVCWGSDIQPTRD
jgi:hypothetical protein